MRSLWIAVALALGIAGLARAQTTPVVPTTKTKLAWSIQTNNNPVASILFRLRVDGTVQAKDLAAVTCAAPVTGVSACEVAFPSLTPGQHTLALQAAVVFEGTRHASAFSAPFVLTVVVLPGTPTGLRVIPGP